MTPDELAKILENHKKWRGGTGGKRANLTGAYLTGADLSGADLTGADPAGADLSGRDRHPRRRPLRRLAYVRGAPRCRPHDPGGLPVVHGGRGPRALGRAPRRRHRTRFDHDCGRGSAAGAGEGGGVARMNRTGGDTMSDRCACQTTRRLEEPLEPDARITLALEYLAQGNRTCTVSGASSFSNQARHGGAMNMAARLQMIYARVALQCRLKDLAETLRDALPDVRTCKLDEPWGEGLTPSLAWLQQATDELAEAYQDEMIEAQA